MEAETTFCPIDMENVGVNESLIVVCHTSAQLSRVLSETIRHACRRKEKIRAGIRVDN